MAKTHRIFQKGLILIMKTYYIVFYRYEGTKTWNHSGLDTDKERLLENLKARTYIDVKSFVVKEVELPD